jgi:D-alanyl-D-alanine carboxypeptidase (penicillin-binding protein 5/6)
MKLLYISIVAFVIAVASSLAIYRQYTTQERILMVPVIAKEDGFDYPSLPTLAGDDTFPVLSAQSVLAIDMDSQIVLYEKDEDAKSLPASTTKIVTALVALDYYPLDKVLIVGNVDIEGQKMHLVSGEKLTVHDLLYGLLIYSANDAAEVLADNYAGGREMFVNAMNLKAKELNLQDSNFTNPSGLDEVGHVSSARDLVRVASYAMENPFFAKTVATRDATVKSEDGKVSHKLTNINELLGKVDGVLGVKTGWTENARENLVTYIVRDDKRLMIALLGSQDRFGETAELIDWIFANYDWREVNGPIN